MDKSFRQRGPDTQQPGVFLASLQVFDSLLTWLTGLIELTEEEQKEAGIYLGNQRCK